MTSGCSLYYNRYSFKIKISNCQCNLLLLFYHVFTSLWMPLSLYFLASHIQTFGTGRRYYKLRWHQRVLSVSRTLQWRWMFGCCEFSVPSSHKWLLVWNIRYGGTELDSSWLFRWQNHGTYESMIVWMKNIKMCIKMMKIYLKIFKNYKNILPFMKVLIIWYEKHYYIKYTEI